MKFYLAPMEGVTRFVYRNLQSEMFGKIDKYFTPFISPNPKKGIRNREKEDIQPENNKGLYVVPQILSNRASDVVKVVRMLEEDGYDEVNLNLGCPSGTVTAKKRGSGFLAYPEELDRFLDEIYATVSIKVSVKTRIGSEDVDELPELMAIYNKYPLEELIVHPRLRVDFYKNHPRMESFRYALQESKAPVCYNGDIYGIEDYEKLCAQFPNLDAVMCGRGVIANPALFRELQGGSRITMQEWLAFHDELLRQYNELLSGDANILFKMKEVMSYMHCMFEESDKQWKKIRKSKTVMEYRTAVMALYDQCKLKEQGGFTGTL